MDAAIPVDTRARPQGFGKPHRTRFPTAPTPIILVYEEEGRPKTPTLTHLSTDSDQVQNCVTCPQKPRSNTVVYGDTSTYVDVA